MEKNKNALLALLVVFVLLLLVMLFAALTSSYPATPNAEEYDTDPAAIQEEDINDGEELPVDEDADTEEVVNEQPALEGGEDVVDTQVEELQN